MKLSLVVFNTLILVVFYAMHFYFFASTFFKAIFMGMSLGILYCFFTFTISFNRVYISRLLLAEFSLLTITCFTAFMVNETQQIPSLYYIPLYIIFILLLAPIMNIPILGYVVLLIIIHRKLVLKDQYTFENTTFSILPLMIGIIYWFFVRIVGVD